MSFHYIPLYLQQCGVTPCKIHIRAVFTSWTQHLAWPHQAATRVVLGAAAEEGEAEYVICHKPYYLN